MVHNSARNVEQPLPVADQQGDQQCCAARVEIGCPTHLIAVGEIDHGTDQLE